MRECGFKSQFELEFSGFSTWQFLKLGVRGFLRVLQYPPLLHELMFQPFNYSQNKCDLNSVKLSSQVVPPFHIAHDMLHTISALCAAHDLHTLCPDH